MNNRIIAFSSRANSRKLVSSIVIVLVLSFHVLGQRKGGRDTPIPPVKPEPPGQSGGGASKSKGRGARVPAKIGDLTIKAPSGCRVWLGDTELALLTSTKPFLLTGQKVSTVYAANSGSLTIRNLKAGPYRITGRKPDYHEYTEDFELSAGENHVSAIILRVISGTLTIKPSVEGTEVELVNLETNNTVGRYSDRLERVEVNPGRYRISTSKEGYRQNVREVSVRPGESIYLEPVVEKLPPPLANRRQAISRIPAAFMVSNDGKYLLFTITSSSADALTNSGTISIRYGAASGNVIIGSLTGLPCQIEFVKLENISEAAVVEGPAPSNQWMTIVVRMRSKDQKRPVSFAINWKLLGIDYSRPDLTQTFLQAEAIEKIKPNFPAAAKNSRATGTVTVLVSIDRSGFVLSAKATDGPFVFRQVSEEAARKWKFKPATRNGVPVDSEQTVQFTFEK